MFNLSKTKIKEIFVSIQGEGPQVGKKHIFVRFCKCNLNCEFCDTDFDSKNAIAYSPRDLYEILKDVDCNIISLTGGEPLMDVDFLYEFLSKYKDLLGKKIYLETNGVMYEELNKIIDYIDYVAMDIKILTATGQQNRFLINERFLKVATKKETFIKVVFNENIIQEEIDFITSMALKYNLDLILQPKMPMDKNLNLVKVFDKFYSRCPRVRLIPQVHKFLNLA